MKTKGLIFLLLVIGTSIILFIQTSLSFASPDLTTTITKVSQARQVLLQPQIQNAEKPTVTHGPLSGEVTATSAILWARGSEPGTLVFEVAEEATFNQPFEPVSVEVTEASDLTGKARIEGLSPGQQYYYRAILETSSATSEPVEAQFRTAPAAESEAAFDFLFGACLGGQGYCRDPETGWIIFETMLAQEPDFFILLGDGVYLDTACTAPDNVAGAEGPYTDLEGMRTRYRYHLEDPHYAEFLAQTPIYVTWDDHEIINDFGGPALELINPQLFAEGKQAYFEYWPVTGPEDDPNRLYRRVSYGTHADFFILDTRSYRDPNVNWDPNPRTLAPKSMLGAEQFAWLQQELAASEATWKFIVTSVPLAYPTGFPQPEVDGRDSWANFTERSGYETELMSLLFFIESQGLNNVIFLTGDTHWPFALSYDPDRDGTPNFYEFGSSPMSAIPLAPPEQLDPTFNPTVMYAEGEFQGTLFNFGHIAITEDGSLTFRVVDREGAERYSLTLPPE